MARCSVWMLFSIGITMSLISLTLHLLLDRNAIDHGLISNRTQ
jgi:hypothetical protein